MRSPRNRIDRFCYSHPNFGIPNLMKYVAIANIVFWLVGAVNPVLANYMIFSPAHILHGQVWRLVTFALMPPGSGVLTFIAVYFYYWVGSTLEQYWGTAQFNIYYFSGILLTILFGFIIYFVTGRNIGITADYINLSMFFSFAALFPDMQVLLFFIIPIKMKWLAIVDAVFFVSSVITEPFPFNLLPVVAILNFFIFCGGDLLRAIPKKPGANTVNFRRESRRIRKEQESRLYNRKCAVCGKTDTDYPTLQFRYCSRCAGYHCFCEEHINNHIHFTE